MRRLARVGLAFCGLALTTPASVWAQSPASPNSVGLTYSAPAPNRTAAKSTKPTKPKKSTKSKTAKAPSHRHERDWLGREIVCPACQYKQAMADGASVPPPPGMPTATQISQVEKGKMVVEGQGTAKFRSNSGALSSGAEIYVSNGSGQPVLLDRRQVTPEMASFLNQLPTPANGSLMVNASDLPGYVVSKGEAPGVAVADITGEGSGPAPVGVSANRGGPLRMAGRRQAAPTDGSVTPTSMPAASNPIDPGPSGNPKILMHLFGVSAFTRDIREGFQMNEQKKRDKHAAISYDAAAQKVTDLPASVVYGQGGAR
ncbi:hypothetical protein [Singulisphaera sp. PoT]|uniref:hypothetical protein n=1 Tax=Singulisphaera sp. PoT TaxID=3411797 RepID=UPI003BF49384